MNNFHTKYLVSDLESLDLAADIYLFMTICSIVVVLGSINDGGGKVELRHKALLVTGVVAIQMSNVLLYGVKTDSARH